ncbi:aspartate/glutamate racemase family protein [Protaetiibacter sp. SSC-01]|uniref:aspartate/glutamate racemase family protein n=1 Tax=Protaetiibacter sp. SSC-01 TaxID=2759943 RepID=UPI00223ABE83|nr:aspartate/glutamate racemase family protein [Protaetiibacter sp. SSC-01]
MRIGFLHTVPALAPRFNADLASAAPGATAVHVVDAELLATAIRWGVDDTVDAAVEKHIAHLAEEGADAVLVTCSSIGESVEKAAARAALPVVRVDARMAADAIAAAGPGGRIAVLATLAATLGPTGRILERAAAEAEQPPVVTATVVPDAADARSAGDTARHDRLVADAVRAAAAEADVIVLAQASMATAADDAHVDVPVLTSPASALAAVVEAAGGSPEAAR